MKDWDLILIQSYFCCCHLLLSSLSDGLFEKIKIRVGISTAIGSVWGTSYEKPSFLFIWDCNLKKEECSVTVLWCVELLLRYLLPWLLLQEAFLHPVRTLCITEGCWPPFSSLFLCLDCPKQNNLTPLSQVQAVAFAVRTGQNDLSWISLFTSFASLLQHLWQCLSWPAFLLISFSQN